MDDAPELRSLRAVRWTRLRAAVRNTRAAGAQDHPLWILHAMLLFAMPETRPGKKTFFTFRPLELGRDVLRSLAGADDAVQRDEVYRFEVLFPGDDLAVPALFAAQLERHLENPQHNFVLSKLGRPELRCLGDLEDAAPVWPPELSEICLEFRTPLAYTPKNDRRPWELGAGDLGSLFAHRLQHLLELPSPAAPAAWTRLATLSNYWEFVEHPHRSRSGAGVKTIAGNVGPLYLRGAPEDLAAVRPWLLLGSELGCGLKLGCRGHFELVRGRPFFDPLLARPATFARALDELERRSDLPDGFPAQLGPAAAATEELAAAVGAGQWQPAAAAGFRADKAGGAGDRLIVQFPARDRLVHQALQILLTPLFDRLFEPQSHGFRPGRGVASVRRFVQEAWAQGYSVALAADIEAFFDSADWAILEKQVDNALPRADVHTRAAIHALLRTSVRLNRRPVPRSRGLLQGSPLSPLLANLHLDPFDEEMTRCGHCLVRYADDFIVLCRSEDEARAALDAAREILAGLGLTLKDAKTAITPFAAGFTFLGVRFGGGFEAELVEDTALEKTLFIRQRFAWLGVDHDAITVREEGRLTARLPFRRVREIVLLGAAGVSTRLVERCAQRGVALSFCSPAGRLQNILWRHDHQHYEMAQARYESLVCDLQEPFRARCDRFVLKIVNRGQVKPGDFTTDPIAGLDLAPPASARFLEAYAEELDTQLAGDPASWARLIETQVLAIERWVCDGMPFKVFFAQPGQAPPPPVLPNPAPPAPAAPPPDDDNE